MRQFLSQLPYLLVKHDLIVSGGWGPSTRQRDAPDASGRLTSYALRGKKAGHFCKVAGVSIFDAGGPCSH